MRSIVARGLAAVAFSLFTGHCAAVAPAVVAASAQDEQAVTTTAVERVHHQHLTRK